VSGIRGDKESIFVPDKSLGSYAAEKTGRELVLWPGYCPTHHRILARDIESLRKEHPGALVAVHPECTGDVRAAADYIGSTSGMLTFCRESDASEFIVGTELGILHRLAKENPGKTFYPTSDLADCPDMKLVTLEKIVWSLEDNVHVVEVAEPVRSRALQAIERMLETR